MTISHRLIQTPPFRSREGTGATVYVGIGVVQKDDGIYVYLPTRRGTVRVTPENGRIFNRLQEVIDAVPRQRTGIIKLSDEPATPYSPMERAAFAALEREPRSTADISDAVYGEDRPVNHMQATLNTLKNLQRKTKLNEEPFTIKNSKRRGPHPINFWVEQNRA